MTDKRTHKKRIINEYRPEPAPVSPPPPTRITETRLNGDRLKQEIINRFNDGQDFQRISSDLGIPYVEVARIAGGLS